ncbi:MAG TPA: ATP-binding protein [Polyangiaceae bacterium]|nr:ATP-binding protein [Polyangiaceae bacterium]
MLRSKAMLLLRREREVYQLRQERGRIEVWLRAVHKLSIDLTRKDAEALLGLWVSAIVDDLNFQVAAVYACLRDGPRLSLRAGTAHAPLAPDAALDADTLDALLSTKSGRYPGDPALDAIARVVGLDSFFWLLLPGRDQPLLLLAGYGTGFGRFHSLNDHDLGHFLLFGSHLAALLENQELIAELDRERSELSASNAQLDASLSKLREAQAKLLQSTKVLAEVSRRAGMADVATGVLHNVGNVLNSVNVSAEMALERLRGLRVAGALRVAELLQRDPEDLAEFFRSDNRGRVLPNYLKELATHLGSEVAGIQAELRSLQENIDHIKSIITKQQAYARTVGVSEPCSITELVEDAIGLVQDSFGELGILVVRDYAEVPTLLLDRHKVVQILVNLLSNAKHALEESEQENKQITICVRHRSGGSLSLQVGDNGVGIAPEHLPKLFTHGFTTKKNGHGFGLHASALAAMELGGSLTGASPGLGCGASFVLELPVRLPFAAQA